MNVEIFRAVSWPVVFLLLGGCVIWILRKKLPVMSDRISGLKVNKDGLEASLAVAAASLQMEAKPPGGGLNEQASVPPSKTNSNDLTPELAQRLDQIRSVHITPIVQEQEKLIEADIERLKIKPPELTDLLIKHLAVCQLALRAEFVYRTVFGSQIALLKAANLFGPRSTEQLVEFYEGAKSKFPLLYESYSFEQFLQYLLLPQLLLQDSSGRYAITMAGKEFLKWLADAGATEKKAF